MNTSSKTTKKKYVSNLFIYCQTSLSKLSVRKCFKIHQKCQKAPINSTIFQQWDASYPPSPNIPHCHVCAWQSQSCFISHVCREPHCWSSSLCFLSLSGCGGLTGETPQRLLRDTVKDASEKAKEAAKNLASAAAAPQKPQQYIWQDSMWRSGQVTWTSGPRQLLFGDLDLNGGFIL